MPRHKCHVYDTNKPPYSWWRHGMETLSALLALCGGNPPVTGGFPSQRAGDAELSLQWRHKGRDSVSNHQPHDCLLNRLFRRRSKKTSKLRVTGLCAGNSPMTGEFPAQMASNAENVSIWWRHHVDVPFGVNLNKQLNNQSRDMWIKLSWSSFDKAVIEHHRIVGHVA